MSKPRIKITAVIDTEAHADTILSNIQNRLLGKDIFESHNLGRGIDLEGNIALNADVRFNLRIDRDDVKDWIKDQVRNHPAIKNWVQSVTVTDHLCSHDDPVVVDCKTTEYVRWERV